MAGLWKAWKAKGRLPTLPTSPLEISPTAGRDFHISTAPATTAAGNVQNQKQVFHVSTATDPRSPKTKKKLGGTGFALRPAAGAPRPA
jgi:hypothetical protein